MTASDFFTGTPPMFGPEKSGAFAWKDTPKWGNVPTTRLRYDTQLASSFCWFDPINGNVWARVDDFSALALCEKQAQAWIMSKGYDARICGEGGLWVLGTLQISRSHKRRSEHATIPPISDQPDWHKAARWVWQQEKKS